MSPKVREEAGVPRGPNRGERRLENLEQLRDAIVRGAAKRVRPKFMTFATTCIGLFPIMWATGTGSDVMKRIAAPMVGGIFTSFVLEPLVYPAIYEVWRRRSLPSEAKAWEALASSGIMLQPGDHVDVALGTFRQGP